MQSYQLHIISEQLKRRHPYLEPPFKARYDSSEVYKAVFDRAIPKLIEILLTPKLSSDKYTNSLITLNEIASDEAQKNNMIEQGCVELASAFCHCKATSIRREATLLLGLLLSTNDGLSKMRRETFEALKNLLFDAELEVREAVSWTLCRIVLSRTGADILCNEGIAKSMIESFLQYSGGNDPLEQHFIIYLLESFKLLLVYDNGISVCLGTGLTHRLKTLTSTSLYAASSNTTIHSLSLCALSNIAMNPEGKAQCVSEKVVQETQRFLESSIEEQVGSTVTVVMFTAIDLTGKKQCIFGDDGKVQTTIICKLISLLEKAEINELIKGDVRECLQIIAQEGQGFLAIADHMSKSADIKHIEDIFGPKIIVPLALLLPQLSDVADPPTLPSHKINDYKAYARAINHFIKKDQEAVQIAVKECVDLALRLIMFVCYRGDKVLQEGVVHSLTRLASHHPYSCELMRKFILQHGSKEHKISKTSVSNQAKRFEELWKLIGDD